MTGKEIKINRNRNTKNNRGRFKIIDFVETPVDCKNGICDEDTTCQDEPYKSGLLNVGLKDENGKEHPIWDESNKGDKTTVAIIDTGIQESHVTFDGKVIKDRKNFVEPENEVCEEENNNDNDGDNNDDSTPAGCTFDPDKIHPHGTHVAGIVNAVAPNTNLIDLRVLNSQGSGSTLGVENGMQYCIDNYKEIDVVNMSLGGSHSSGMEDKVNQLSDKGVLVVVAAGNSGDDNVGTWEYSFPAGYKNVVSVGAMNPRDDKLAFFSSTNYEVDMAAPGVDICSAVLDNKYKSYCGTSMAAPHSAGFAALLISKYNKEYLEENNLTEIPNTDAFKKERHDEVRDQLVKFYTRDIDNDGVDNGFGHGTLSVNKKEEPLEEPSNRAFWATVTSFISKNSTTILVIVVLIIYLIFNR